MMSHPATHQTITFIYTADLATSATFYEQVLGLTLWRDQGTCRIYEVIPGGMIGICQTGAGAKGQVSTGQQTNLILTIVSRDVDGWYAHLQSNGAAIEHPPVTNEKYRIYHFFLRDPDGYLIEIQQFLED